MKSVSVTTATSGPRQRRLSPEAGNTEYKKKPTLWLFGVLGLIVVVCMGVGGTALAHHWPYSEVQVVPALQEAFKSTVTIREFRRFYFPNPGCEMEVVQLASPSKIAGHQPLATAQKIRITGRYSDWLVRPYHLAEVEVDGLHVRIPSRTEPRKWTATANGTSSKVSVGRVTTNGAVLEIERAGSKEVLKFEIHKLVVESIAAGRPMSYQVTMGIPEPPGELESKGNFGPWQGDGDIGKIPLSGSANLNRAKLDKFPGLGGTIRSEEHFGGTLEQVDVTGQASAPDFELKSAGHKVELASQFDVMVNATKGEAELKGIVGRVGKTTIHLRGGVMDVKGDHREAAVDFSITNGRAEDLLWVFSGTSKPAMFGTALCSGHVRMKKFGEGFLDALQASGKFEVKDGHFQPPIQKKANEMSARASGQKIKSGSEPPEVPVENLSSDVKIQNGVAHLSTTYFQVPGARVRVEGTYKLDNSQVDLHGNLWTNASLSDNTTGIKTLLLEPLDPLFRRKHAGAMIGVSMTGDIHSPTTGTALTKKKAAWGKQQHSNN